MTSAGGLLRGLDDALTRRCVTAERVFLVELGGDCSMPAGAFAEPGGDGSLVMRALLADGSGRVYRRRLVGDDGEALGTQLARELTLAIGAPG